MMVLGMQVQPASIRGLPHFFSFSRTAAFGSDSSSGTGTTAATLMTISSSFDGSQHKQAKATIPEIRPSHREAPTPPPPVYLCSVCYRSMCLPCILLRGARTPPRWEVLPPSTGGHHHLPNTQFYMIANTKKQQPNTP